MFLSNWKKGEKKFIDNDNEKNKKNMKRNRTSIFKELL